MKSYSSSVVAYAVAKIWFLMVWAQDKCTISNYRSTLECVHVEFLYFIFRWYLYYTANVSRNSNKTGFSFRKNNLPCEESLERDGTFGSSLRCGEVPSTDCLQTTRSIFMPPSRTSVHSMYCCKPAGHRLGTETGPWSTSSILNSSPS